MARDHCASIGGHLAAINSALENDFLVALIGAITNFWIGGMGNATVFVWDGWDPWTFSAFAPTWTTPSTLACVELFNDGIWRTYPCSSLPYFICEAELDVLRLTTRSKISRWPKFHLRCNYASSQNDFLSDSSSETHGRTININVMLCYVMVCYVTC